MRTIALTLVAALVLLGCASTAPPAPSGPRTVEQRTALAESLAVERQWLQSWFKGTPVAIGQRNDGAVTVAVPREFCFEPRKSGVRPGLAAVLDKVAESLRRLPQAQLLSLAAPDDAAGTSPLAVQRANQVLEHLRARGVVATRLGKPTATAVPAVQLLIGEAPALSGSRVWHEYVTRAVDPEWGQSLRTEWTGRDLRDGQSRDGP